jgi:hypothetical protein
MMLQPDIEVDMEVLTIPLQENDSFGHEAEVGYQTRLQS